MGATAESLPLHDHFIYLYLCALKNEVHNSSCLNNEMQTSGRVFYSKVYMYFLLDL